MYRSFNGSARLSLGFTMVELLLVIIVIALLGMIAMPQFLDFRQEARIAAAQKYSTSLQAAITQQKAQIMLKCGQPLSTWPRKEAIELNDITENGAPGAHCTTTQIPDIANRKFLDQGELLPPLNPTNTRRDIVYTNCTDLCSCPDEGGYLYNASTGALGHSGILDKCREIAAAESSSTSTSTSTSASNSTSNSSATSSVSNSSSPASSSQGFSEESCPGTYTGIYRYDLIEGQCYSAGTCDATGEEVHPGYPNTPNSYEECVSSNSNISYSIQASCNGTPLLIGGNITPAIGNITVSREGFEVEIPTSDEGGYSNFDTSGVFSPVAGGSYQIQAGDQTSTVTCP